MSNTRTCIGGCGEAIPATNKSGFKYGHKNGCTPPRTSLAIVEGESVIDAPNGDAEEWIECSISVTQLDAIYAMLSGHQKAHAVLTALNAEQA